MNLGLNHFAAALRVALVAMVGWAGANAYAQAPGVTDKEIVIGEVMPLSGPPALLGVAHNLGSQIAVAEINAAGGIHGRKIRLVNEEDAYVPARTVQALRKLIDVDKVFAVTATSGSAHTQAVMPILDEEGIPMLNSASPNRAQYTPPHKTVFNVGVPYNDAVFDLIRFMNSKRPAAKWAGIFQDDDTGKDQEAGYLQAMSEFKLTSVSLQKFKRGQSDFSSEMLKVKESGATALFAGGIIAENVAMVKEAKRLGIDLYAGAIWFSHLRAAQSLMGEAGDGFLVYDYVPPMESPLVVKFLEKARLYLKADDIDKMNRYSLTAYAGMKTMAQAIQACGVALTRACVVAELGKLSNFDTGVMSPISFTNGKHMSFQKGRALVNNFKTMRFEEAR